MNSQTVCLLILGICAVHSFPKRMKRSADVNDIFKACSHPADYMNDEDFSKEAYDACTMDCIAKKSGLNVRSRSKFGIEKFVANFDSNLQQSIMEAVKLKCDLVDKVGKCSTGSQLLECLEKIEINY